MKKIYQRNERKKIISNSLFFLPLQYTTRKNIRNGWEIEMSSRNGWKMTDDLSIVIQRNYRDLVRTSSEMKSRQAVLAALTRLSMPMAASVPRHAFRPILYPLHRSCPAIYLVFQTSYVITLARTWAERGRSQPPWISGVLIDVSVRAFPVWSATAREDQSRCGGRKDFVEHRLRLWNFVEIHI